jgi:histidinol dehydrogenase
VRVERLDATGDPVALARELRARAAPEPDVSTRVAEIVARVRSDGDEAVLALTRELDTGGADPWPLQVEPLQLREAEAGLPGPLREALELAAGNVRAVALASLHGARDVDLPQGQRVVLREEPVRRAAVYVPGGRAPYPSTVVMGAVTALAAGVEEVVVCSPPGADGDVAAIVLGACALCGVEEVYRMGGAQAVAALALGTETVPAVDVVAGPGNVWVQEAKRQLSGVVGIDSFAGPSELVVAIDDPAHARAAALDLIAQGEHGAGSVVAAVSPTPEVLDAVAAELGGGATGAGAGPASGGDGSATDGADGAPAAAQATCWLVETGDLDSALAFAEAFAPEHLELIGRGAEGLAGSVRSAGCVFVGASAATAFGDYVAGSNHVLPTGGAARFASALSVRTFRRTMSEVRVGDAAGALARAGAAIARAEGFEAHAESMEARIGENGPHG